MSWIDNIFDVFSKRNDEASIELHIPQTFKNRVLIWCKDVFSNNRSFLGHGDYSEKFWAEIHHFFQYKQGVLYLTDPKLVTNPTSDVLPFLRDCPSECFFDFIEYIFRVECFFHVGLSEEQLIDEINEFFKTDNLPFYLTKFVKETVKQRNFTGRESKVINILEYPKIIIKDNDVIHKQAVEPTLHLLTHPIFKNANKEFLEALEDYRKEDFDDCLTKCGSSFESILKILCKQNNLPYKETETASTLIKRFLDSSKLENYFEPVLIIIATLRNKLSTSHGAGTTNKEVPKHIANYTINVTAAAILLVVHEANMQ